MPLQSREPMLDFKRLNTFSKEISGLDYQAAKMIVQHKQVSKREKWILDRFLKGYYNKLGMPDSTEIILMPTSETIAQSTLDVCKEGIELFLDQSSIDLSVKITGTNGIVSSFVNDRVYESNRGTIFPDADFHAFVYRRMKMGIFPMKYTCYVDSSDFFQAEDYAAGKTFILGNIATLLERGFIKGRLLDKSYLFMTMAEKTEYMKLVAAHETYHLIGKLTDLEKQSHEEMGLTEDPNCLGYSKFKIPSYLCGGCKDSIASLWHGYRLRQMCSP